MCWSISVHVFLFHTYVVVFQAYNYWAVGFGCLLGLFSSMCWLWETCGKIDYRTLLPAFLPSFDHLGFLLGTSQLKINFFKKLNKKLYWDGLKKYRTSAWLELPHLQSGFFPVAKINISLINKSSPIYVFWWNWVTSLLLNLTNLANVQPNANQKLKKSNLTLIHKSYVCSPANYSYIITSWTTKMGTQVHFRPLNVLVYIRYYVFMLPSNHLPKAT